MRLIASRTAALAWCEERRGTAAVEPQVEAAVAAIVAEVAGGDEATLKELSRRFDGVAPETVVVDRLALRSGAERVGADLRAAIDLAGERVRDYYQRQPSEGFSHQASGVRLGQLLRPLDSVGCYVPGGSNPLFSSLIMTAVPAQVAGVETIVAATPPSSSGGVPDEVAYVALSLGIDTVVALGGAQAIAAMALGRGGVPRVDKVVGPGNRYVVAAKRQLFGRVGIESLPGPTETLVLADDSASVDHVIADLLAQAEHDGAQPVLVTTSKHLADTVMGGIVEAAGTLPTAEIALESLEQRGVVVLATDMPAALEVLNAYAPEHACLLVEDPWSLVPQVRHAGGLFLGSHSLEALGDYVAGPSHVMPTGATARFASFVNLRDFQKVIPFLDADPAFVAEVGPAAARLARAEGLEAHARAVESRLRE